MKKTILFILSILVMGTTIAQTKNPSDFFEIPYGSKFQPHHKIISYFEHLAATNPKRAKLVSYGQTNEGRPLMVLMIASEENFLKLEENRLNNLKSIGLLAGTPTQKTIPICWLSYNVHGNESSATTASVPTAYDLLDSNNSISKKILSNTIVFIDPCINPDGYDRYVNWYNQKVGQKMNVNGNDWQHNEPWPGGRFNHYCFDLNRDWAWQTQIESKGRLALYQKWMPHLHVDFHEQGVNSPYYFPPSAKPYHEDITAWQREMQTVVGEFQKKYFDKNDWLYFTKENFDLLYPSYGDTYPTYNGAIAYTLEQGGSGRAGLGIIDAIGDTLTLQKRYLHHHASGFAGLEAISSRAEKVIDEYIKFYDKARNAPIGLFKSYIIKNKTSDPNVKSLLELLDKQQIKYGTVGKKLNIVGAYNYKDDKNEGLVAEAEDVLISAFQPKSNLLKILFEPKTVVEDSVTYDITAWSLPYAFGIECFGIKDKLLPLVQENTPQKAVVSEKSEVYAFVCRWKGVNDIKVLTALLAKKVKVKSSEKSFEIGNEKFDIGTLVITKGENQSLGKEFESIIEKCLENSTGYIKVNSGMVSKGNDFGSGVYNYVKAPTIAIIGGEGASPTHFGDVWYFIDNVLQYPSTVIAPNTISNNTLKDFSVLVIPEGYYGKSLDDKTLGTLKEWIRAGGKLIVLGNANGSFADKDDFELKHKKEDKKKDEKPENDLKVFANRERESVSNDTPGSIYKLNIENTHPLGYGFGKNYHALVLEASDYAYLKDGWNVAFSTKNSQVAGFVGFKAKEKLENSLMMGVQEMGRGKVVYMINNPMFRNFWESGKLFFGNALFMQ